MFRVLIFFILIYSAVSAQMRHTFNIASNEPSNSVVVSPDSTKWIATENGITATHLFEFKSYTTNNGLSSNYVTDAAIKNSNPLQLWMTTDNGVTYFDVEHSTLLSDAKYLNVSSDKLVSDNLTSVTFDYSLNAWLGSDVGISIVEGSSVSNLDETKFSHPLINDLAVAHDTVNHKNAEYIPKSGVIYAATNGGGVSRFYMHEVDGVSTASVVSSSWSGLLSDTVFTVYVDKNNYHYYGTPNGVAFHQQHDSKNAQWFEYTVNDGLVNNRVKAITQDKDGNFIFGTEGGISSLVNGVWYSFTESKGLISNNVKDVAVDSNNVLWVATDKGYGYYDVATDIVENKSILPDAYKLKINAYPNPFNPTTNIKIDIAKTTNIKVEIYSITGEYVATLFSGFQNQGSQIYRWNASSFNSGVFIVKVESEYGVASKKIMMLK